MTAYIMSLREKLDHQRRLKYRPFTRTEALAAGYGEDEVAAIFGDSAIAPGDGPRRRPLQRRDRHSAAHAAARQRDGRGRFTTRRRK